MVPALGHSDLSPAPGQLRVPARPGLVVAPSGPDQGRARLSVSDYLPFLITLLAGGIVVAAVALALGGPSRRASTVPLPPPSASATPAPHVGPTAGHRRSGR